MEPAVLHVYPQGAWHDDVLIAGNRQALEGLARAVARALEQGADATEEVFAADGEGYRLVVRPVDQAWQGSEWQGMRLPYTEEYARGGADGQQHGYGD